MVDDSYIPYDVVIEHGQTVTWRNAGQKVHDVASTTGAWSAEPITPGTLWRRTFGQPGTYPFYCQYHPEMRGEIVVR